MSNTLKSSPDHRRLKIQNQNKPLLNRPSRTPRTISKRFEVPTTPSTIPSRTYSQSHWYSTASTPPKTSSPLLEIWNNVILVKKDISYQFFANFSLHMAFTIIFIIFLNPTRLRMTWVGWILYSSRVTLPAGLRPCSGGNSRWNLTGVYFDFEFWALCDWG